MRYFSNNFWEERKLVDLDCLGNYCDFCLHEISTHLAFANNLFGHRSDKLIQSKISGQMSCWALFIKIEKLMLSVRSIP